MNFEKAIHIMGLDFLTKNSYLCISDIIIKKKKDINE